MAGPITFPLAAGPKFKTKVVERLISKLYKIWIKSNKNANLLIRSLS